MADLSTEGIEVRGPVRGRAREILSADALRLVARLHREFDAGRRGCLQRRVERQARLDAGELPDFLPQTRPIREAPWRVAPIPADLADRRVEITGPVDRKMMINALNSGAQCFMADFEDAHSPTWQGTIDGQVNVRDAVQRTIEYVNPANQKQYRLNDETATLIIRPRGWHMVEKHVLVDEVPVSASLFDFGLALFHNAAALLDEGSGPYFYLPKLEDHREARLWNDVFVMAQREVGIPQGSIRATVLIETIPAAFEMDEILYELRDHIAGLNCGRWDYIFSFIKRFRAHPEMVLPDRAQVTMTSHCMRSYSLLAIKTCHHRGAAAIGGMAAQIPIKDDPIAHAQAVEKVRKDKEREANDGHDGTWVAHPGLVQPALDEFNRAMRGTNQIDRQLPNLQVTAEDLLRIPVGAITEEGLRTNIRVGTQYLAAWLAGNGCVPLYHLMEDAATAEISRTQAWQWLHNGTRLADKRTVTVQLLRNVLEEELGRIRAEIGAKRVGQPHFELAVRLFKQIVEQDELEEFLTLKAYAYLP
jgi:malate synthase